MLNNTVVRRVVKKKKRPNNNFFDRFPVKEWRLTTKDDQVPQSIDTDFHLLLLPKDLIYTIFSWIIDVIFIS
jgi:hypothetical protein